MKEYKEFIELAEKEVSKYFRYCPLCYAEDSMEFEWSFHKDYMMCSDCGAKWHINYGLTGFHWAKLVKENAEGRGTNLLQEKHDPEFWQHMALKGRKTIREKEITLPQVTKEIIREKEVIVKIRCPYCHNLYDESLDKCPHCGGKR